MILRTGISLVCSLSSVYDLVTHERKFMRTKIQKMDFITIGSKQAYKDELTKPKWWNRYIAQMHDVTAMYRVLNSFSMHEVVITK